MTGQTSIDIDAQKAIKPHLDQGEVLLWAEKPSGWRLALPQLPGLLAQTAFIAIFVVIFFPIPRYREYLLAVLIGDVPLGSLGFNEFFAFFFLIFIASALFGVVRGLKHFLSSWFTFYGLTSKRLIILQTMPPSGISSLGPRAFTTIRWIGKDGLGTIILGDGKASENEETVSGFKKLFGITNPAGVEALIVSTLRPVEKQGKYS